MVKEGRVSIFWSVILAIGIIWLLNDLDVLPINLPWLPIVLIVIAAGMVINKSKGR